MYIIKYDGPIEKLAEEWPKLTHGRKNCWLDHDKCTSEGSEQFFKKLKEFIEHCNPLPAKIIWIDKYFGGDDELWGEIFAAATAKNILIEAPVNYFQILSNSEPFSVCAEFLNAISDNVYLTLGWNSLNNFFSLQHFSSLLEVAKTKVRFSNEITVYVNNMGYTHPEAFSLALLKSLPDSISNISLYNSSSNLRSNQIFSEFLQSRWSAILSLSLSEFFFTEEVLAEFSAILSLNTTLTSLKVASQRDGNGYLSKDGFDQLIAALVANAGLQKISLGVLPDDVENVEIDSLYADRFVQRIAKLQSLDIWQIGESVVFLVAKALAAENCQLASVNMSTRKEMSYEAFSEIAEAVRINRSLVEIDLPDFPEMKKEEKNTSSKSISSWTNEQIKTCQKFWLDVLNENKRIIKFGNTWRVFEKMKDPWLSCFPDEDKVLQKRKEIDAKQVDRLQMYAPLLAFVRANRDSAFRFSIIPLWRSGHSFFCEEREDSPKFDGDKFLGTQFARVHINTPEEKSQMPVHKF